MQAMSSTEAWYEMRCWNIDLGAQSLNFQHFASDLCAVALRIIYWIRNVAKLKGHAHIMNNDHTAN